MLKEIIQKWLAIKDLFTSLKYAYQRAVRYYDDMATYQLLALHCLYVLG